jgi:hypothetical protein
MALHQVIQRVLLFGVKLDQSPEPPRAPPPAALVPLIESMSAAHAAIDSRAIRYGHRYRSGFWMIYLLSAFAVLCAVLPLALGWDSASHAVHRYSGIWAVVEVAVIAVVSAIYWRGHRSDWQGEWLRARTTAELIAYLPMIAPLLDFSQPSTEPNWYLRILDPGQHPHGADEISRLCQEHESEARRLLEAAWRDPNFATSYAVWTVDVLRAQQRYHSRLAARQHALLHRVHRITIVLFVLTAVGALTHLLVHTLWLSLVTTFFPALAASLHGALAQSEAYRLNATAERLTVELQDSIDRIITASKAPSAEARERMTAAVESAVALIMEEHQDWQMLVRPHHLPLA